VSFLEFFHLARTERTSFLSSSPGSGVVGL
jgi:hypothetical protein